VAPPSVSKASRVRTSFSLLRRLFPSTHQRARNKLTNFRLDTIPRLKHRAQSRIFQAIQRSHERKRAKRALAQSLHPAAVRKQSRILQYIFSNHANLSNTGLNRPIMSYDYTGARVPGARRERLKGYLKAANELRQSYQDTLQHRLQGEDDYTSGNFADGEIVRRGDEEMVLFPSYARRHIKRDPAELERNPPGAYTDQNSLVSSGDADYWKREWEKYEDANAIVDVDVRGWIYSPQKGPASRRNRLIIAVARKLSGVPAPSTPSPMSSRSGSPHPPADAASRNEEVAAAQEAENIAQRGQREADAAWRGSYSLNSDSRVPGSPASSRSNSPSRHLRTRSANLANYDTDSELDKRASWTNDSFMNREDLLKANDLLMTRLRPFLTLPLANTTITVFFFNDSKSSSKTVTTNESGHFNVRAALDFVPTQVRVLASENLSATEDVIITESRGVSLISDVDDTIKHSAISKGVKEIFKNTFVRELGELTIKGVREWYTRLSNMGVQLHYVSNSPWQLFPLLKNYFQLAGLPPGSFHLKEYSGMLHGIFEPAAERKRGSLERILSDFPGRKFILVGDSGEADLEVYTDVVLAHPGRVLGVFIRDVTSPEKKGFFDQSNIPLPDSLSRQFAGLDSPTSDAIEDRPALPNRPGTQQGTKESPHEDLIDFSDEPDSASVRSTNTSKSSDLRRLDSAHSNGYGHQPPSKPAKPSNLRSASNGSSSTAARGSTLEENPTGEAIDRKKGPPPPKPRRSSRSVNPASANSQQEDRPQPARFYSSGPSAPPRPLGRTPTSSSMRSTLSGYSGHSEEGYVAAAQRRLNTAYNALPAIRSQSRDRGDGAPPVPPRRGITAVPAAAARWATGATGGDPMAGGDGGLPGASYDKKEEMWKRRWARAEDIMQRQRIVLRTWRVGTDVMQECIQLVERELQGQQNTSHTESARSGRRQ
jgi:phosphatidate phosphatase APP1